MIYFKFCLLIKCNRNYKAMQSVVKRIGYFLKETSPQVQKGGATRYIIRYFLVDNHHNIYYTENFVQLASILRTSKTLKEACEKAEDQLKRVRMSDVKVSEIKKYKQPEILSFLNQVCLDVSVFMTSDLADNSTLTGAKGEDVKKFQFFTFKDYHLSLMHKFLTTYEKYANSPQAAEEDIRTLEWFDSDVKDHAKKVQIEKSLEDKLLSLSEQLSKVKDIEKAIAGSLTRTPTIEMLTTHMSDEVPTEVKVNEDATSDGKEEFAVIDGSPNEDGTSKPQSLGNSQIDDGKIVAAGKSIYSGPMTEGIPEGKGKEYFSDDLSYVGEYKAGKRHGTGYFVFANQGMCYVESINGKISGI